MGGGGGWGWGVAYEILVLICIELKSSEKLAHWSFHIHKVCEI